MNKKISKNKYHDKLFFFLVALVIIVFTSLVIDRYSRGDLVSPEQAATHLKT